MKKIIAALMLTVGIHSNAFAASKSVVTVIAKPIGNCLIAENKNTPVKRSDQCTLAVSFTNKELAKGAAIKGVEYWVERRIDKGEWKRFATHHAFKKNSVNEHPKFQARSTAEYRVAFDTTGLKTIPEYYTKSFTIYAK